MSDYDAFGRKRHESGHDELGWGTTDAGAEPVATPPAPSTPDSAFSGQPDFTPVSTGPPVTSSRSSRGLGCVPAILVVLATVGAGIYFVVDAGRDAVNTARDTFESLSPGGGGRGGGDQGDDKVPGQIGARKLFTADGLRSAIKTLEREVPGKVTNFAIRRDRINATIVRGGTSRYVNFDADAEVPEVLSESTGASATGAFNYEEINYAAPARLIKAANARVNRSEADVDYLVAQKFTGTMQWGVYYKGGSPIAQGDSQGRFTRRIS